ncbi:hypothetical protein HLB30_05020 [Peptostreptococcus russellii]|uniref:hypothetical protein n=1 Tax=Peptostreptococcus russellii TaxID=215200 RepID=UPI0016242FF3|nr:hypothetical protein [Peptostreptococcus russellii]MBC2577878.1 hypothetical protein [Peptostreptococcus russellii]
MKGILKKIITLLVLVFVLIAAAGYSLKATDPIDDKDRLCNVDERMDVAQINKRVIKSVGLQGDGAIVDMELNNYTFRKLLKYNLVKYGKQDFEAYSFNLRGDKLLVQAPKKIGPFDSQIDVWMSLGNDKDNMILSVDKVKVGKIPLPKSLVDNKLDDMVSLGVDRISTEKGKIYISLNNVDLGIEKMYIKDSNLKLKLKITKDDIRKIGIEIIDSLFDF